MYKKLEELLVQFDEYHLERLISHEIEAALEYLAGPEDKTRREWLVQCALATHGIGLFREKVARTGLFGLLGEEELVRTVQRLCKGAPSEKPLENALKLSDLPWASGFPVVEFVGERFEIPISFLPHESVSTSPVENLEPFRPLPPLHPHQEDVRSQIEEIFQNGSGNLLVQMPTGSGKTRTMVEALASCWGETLGRGCLVWLAHSEELCEQAADSFARVWPQRASQPARLVRLFGKHEPPPFSIPGSIVIASLQKIYYRRKKGSFITKVLQSRAHVVVFDEAHRALAPSFQDVTEFLTAEGAPLAGLSATPGRGIDQDKENKRLANLFDAKLVEPSGKGDVVSRLENEGILASVIRREVDTGVEVYPVEKDLEDLRLGFDYGAVILKSLARNRTRNKLLLDIVKEEVANKRPTILFACSVSHARILSAALNLGGVSAACIHAELPQSDRYSAVEGFRSGEVDVLTNFGVLTTGFDAPRTRTVIVARPTNSAVLYAQMVGRALRGPKMGGGEKAWVVDVRDNLERFGAVTNVYNAFERFWDE